MKAVLVFVAHQFIATIGVMIGAGFLTSFVLELLRLFGRPVPIGYLFWVLTGTPYFPVQITLALFLGWLLFRYFRHRVMQWVWILPFAILCYVIVALPTPAASLARESRLSHFFGWGCRPQNQCFDQLGATLPFYISAAYSVGALLASKMSKKSMSGQLTPRTAGGEPFRAAPE